MDDNCGEWVESMGMVIRRWVWLAGGIYGVVFRRWVWSERIGVVSGCCKEVYRFPHITYPYSTCIRSFLQQHPYFFVHFAKSCFF